MVQVRKSFPQNNDGSLAVDRWIAQLNGFEGEQDRQRLTSAIRVVEQAQALDPDVDEKGIRSNGKIGCFASGLEMARILSELHLDENAIIAALAYRAVREKRLELSFIETTLGSEVATLIEGVLRMAAISELRHEQQRVLGQAQIQSEKIRRMLVAMVDDVRVGLIKLAERTQAIRGVKLQPRDRQIKVAREVFDIYAPLAHRLGIGQIKWELEDLSFRYLEPEEYKNIAKLLDEKRISRQEYIDEVVSLLSAQIDKEGLQAKIDGRAKHIYSIWRKMKRKGVSFDQVYDIRALRVLVSNVSDCYACLGVVHSLWRNIPREFDDYIANPKSNGYRSLHTAVVGPEGKIIEVQIRTHEMHEEAELGVCAHWLYKGTDASVASGSYEQKIEWLRQVLEWQEEASGIDDVNGLASELVGDIEKDRIYVFTPQGHVVDLAHGSTPVDFAYHIHTDIGHRCRGAKVDGRIVPLDTTLDNGQKVEILTGKEIAPNRDWLREDLGFLNSARARSKVRAWFKQQARAENIVRGRELVEREFRRLAITGIDHLALARRMGFSIADDLYAALGAGDISTGRILAMVEALLDTSDVDRQPQLFSVARETIPGDAIQVSGVGNLLTVIARCCKPVPGDDIAGYVTQQRGVTIHRQDCADYMQSVFRNPNRSIEVSWGAEAANRYPVDIELEAYDRTGLIKDVSTLLSVMRVNVVNINTHTDRSEGVAYMRLTIEINDVNQLVRILGRLGNLPNVISAVRVT